MFRHKVRKYPGSLYLHRDPYVLRVLVVIKTRDEPETRIIVPLYVYTLYLVPITMLPGKAVLRTLLSACTKLARGPGLNTHHLHT